MGQMHDPIATRAHLLRCPLCEVYELEPAGHDSARCSSCGGSLCGELVKTPRQTTELPDAIGWHPCEECSHPEMRGLPDGVFHCPACGSEVVPIARS